MTAPVNNRSLGPESTGQASETEAKQAAKPGPVKSDATGVTIRLPGLAGRGPLRVWLPALNSPLLQGLLALGIFLVVWLLVYAFPLVARPGIPQLDQTSADPNFYAWCLRWWPYAIAHGLNPLYSTQVGAPTGFDLTWTTTVPPLALLATPLTLISGPIVALSVLVALAPPLSAWAAFVACRRLTRRFWPSLAGGVIYGFSAYELNHTAAAQLNMTWSLLLPLIVYLVLLWRDGKLSRPWFVGLLALAMLAQLFLFVETFFQMTVVLVASLVVGWLLAGQAGRAEVKRLAALFGMAYVAVVVVASPYVYYMLTHQPHGFNRSVTPYDLDLAALVTPRPNRTFGWSWLRSFATHSVNMHSYGSYIGIPALLIVVALAIWTWKKSRLTRFLVLIFVLILILSVGTDLVAGNVIWTSVPWSKFWSLPLVRSALPNRFMVLASLAVAIMVAVWLAAPLRNRWLTLAQWVLGILAVWATMANITPVAARATHGIKVPAFISTGEYKHFIKPGETILVISTRGNAGMLFQADSGFYWRLAGGYINMAITPRTDLPTPVQAMAHPVYPITAINFNKYLKQAGIGAIIVEKGRAPLWARGFWRLCLHGRTIGGMIFYDIGSSVSCVPARN